MQELALAPARAPSTPPGEVALAIRGLRKKYGRRLALDGLDLTVPSGVVYGFLGPNGAGKTTTMRVLAGLIRADAGKMELLGRPYSGHERRRLFDVGSLIEAPSFYPYLSARDNLRVIGATGKAVSTARVDELIDLVGLRERARDKVSRYSMGMKQRLGIAAALLNAPKLLLLDEPANGLDPAGIVGMRETLRGLAASGTTVFVSSHILAEVEQLADVVGIIAAGKLVREGRLDEMLATQHRLRVRVRPDEIERAKALLAAKVGAERVTVDADEGWLTMVAAPDDASEINRALAAAGIYASGLESGSDLEALFLEATRHDTSSGGEGGFGVGYRWPPRGGAA